jgi:hypothetical protein
MMMSKVNKAFLSLSLSRNTTTSPTKNGKVMCSPFSVELVDLRHVVTTRPKGVEKDLEIPSLSLSLFRGDSNGTLKWGPVTGKNGK